MSHPVNFKISTHVLDTTRGKAASGIKVSIYKFKDNNWTLVGDGIETNRDGRANLIREEVYEAGRYKLHFDVEPYFQSTKTASIYPFIEIIFDAAESEKYHIPVLLNPFGYTTYRGT